MRVITNEEFEEAVTNAAVLKSVDLGSASVIFAEGEKPGGITIIINTPVGKHLLIPSVNLSI